MHTQHFAQTSNTSGWAYGLWEDTRNGERALVHDGGAKGCKSLMYLLPQHDAGFFLAYNLADQHPDGVLQEPFITKFRQRFLPARQSISEGRVDRTSTEQFVGDYLYVRRARTTMEKTISVVNRLRVTRGDNGALTITVSSGSPIPLTPIGPRLFRRADDRGVVAFDGLVGNRANRLVTITDSGFPAVYERIPLFATLRVQLAWLLGMALPFLYAGAWRPIGAVVRTTRVVASAPRRWSTWLTGVASALNLLFIVGFPLTFLGRIEGGVPEFLYGVPVLTTGLLLIPPITGILGVAAAMAVVGMWLDGRTPIPARLPHSLVAVALLSFVVFAWYWNLMPTLAS
jgi:hypothetical protein